MTQIDLRRRMIEDMTVRNLSPATQRSSIGAVSKRRYLGDPLTHWSWRTCALSKCILSRASCLDRVSMAGV